MRSFNYSLGTYKLQVCNLSNFTTAMPHELVSCDTRKSGGL